MIAPSYHCPGWVGSVEIRETHFALPKPEDKALIDASAEFPHQGPKPRPVRSVNDPVLISLANSWYGAQTPRRNSRLYQGSRSTDCLGPGLENKREGFTKRKRGHLRLYT